MDEAASIQVTDRNGIRHTVRIGSDALGWAVHHSMTTESGESFQYPYAYADGHTAIMAYARISDWVLSLGFRTA